MTFHELEIGACFFFPSEQDTPLIGPWRKISPHRYIEADIVPGPKGYRLAHRIGSWHVIVQPVSDPIPKRS